MKLFIGPMSKNVVDATIAVAEERKKFLCLIPSRRQIDFNGGYSNNWKTKNFASYVRSKTKLVSLQRDHGGPLQGSQYDQGYDSFAEDAQTMDLIHIDPWKSVSSFEEGVDKTIDYLNFCYKIDQSHFYEVGTEEAIFPYTSEQLECFLQELRDTLPYYIFDKIEFAVIQSGTAIRGTKNVGVFSENKLRRMVEVCKDQKMCSKEHNGDYLTLEGISRRFELGLDAINIAPEFGVAETEVILEALREIGSEPLKGAFYDLCFRSGKWKKWVGKKKFPEFYSQTSPEEFISLTKVCGHYLFASTGFKKIKKQIEVSIPDLQDRIQVKLQNKINGILDACEV